MAVKNIPRLLGVYGGRFAGPTVICVGGLHGNEPAGVFTLQRVLEKLERRKIPFRGQFVALAGNLRALAEGSRFVDRDLNRLWPVEFVDNLRTVVPEKAKWHESTEQRALLLHIERFLSKPSVFVDLHTTSAAGPPFTIVSDTIMNRRLALQIPAPLVLGLEENLHGTLLNFVNELGHAAIGFEGGQHQSSDSITNQEIAVWTILESVHCIAEGAVPKSVELRAALEQRTKALPRIMEIRHRHGIGNGDRFSMNPGLKNFQPVARGQILAYDFQGPIRAQESSRIFMPLYQSQGDDGFFLVREVTPFWLRVSTAMRWLRFELLLPLLPGVRRHATEPGVYLVDPRIARWRILDIFHLLGFRKRESEDQLLVMSRRKE